MRSTLFLRIASVLTLIHAVLHTIGGVFGKPTGAQQAVVDVMKANEFLVMGVMRSFWSFYRGMGLAVSVALTVEAIVFWQLGSLAKRDPAGIRLVMMTFMVGYLCLAAVSSQYFFPAPVVTEVLIAACLGVAIAGSRQAAMAPPAVLEGRGSVSR
jgi:hypothetical protein